MARIEQNFEQAYTGITPGDNFDLDWGIGKIVKLGGHAFDIGVSGFAPWQITTQSGGPSVGRYQYQRRRSRDQHGHRGRMGRARSRAMGIRHATTRSRATTSGSS